MSLLSIKASSKFSTIEEVGITTLEYSFVDPYTQEKNSESTEVLITE